MAGKDFERVERGGKVDRREIDGIDRVIGREIAQVPGLDAALDRRFVKTRLEDVLREVG